MEVMLFSYIWLLRVVELLLNFSVCLCSWLAS